MMKLLISALVKFLVGLLLVAALIFFPAGTLLYPGGLLFLSQPLVLGSWYALIPFAVYPVLMVVRIRGEEKLLTAELAGYEEYKKKVRYRMIPFVW